MLKSLLSACAAGLLALSAAHGQTFSNSASINIPDSGVATPYPSVINVAGLPNTTAVQVRLRGFTHSFPGDVRVLLVAPTGQAIQLLNGNGGGADAIALNLTLSSAPGTPALPDPLVSGTFLPSGGSNALPSPAPGTPYGNNLSSLVGLDPNGSWQLYVDDTAGGDSGFFQQGWALDFGTPPTLASPTAFTYQGRLAGGQPNGPSDVRFSMWGTATGNDPALRLGGPVTVSNVAVSDGLFTAQVDLGVLPPPERVAFLQIDVASPSGSAFVPLSPRQPITPTPLAGRAAALSDRVAVPLDTEIAGPQGDRVTGSLTIRAPGTVVSNGDGARGGTLRLMAGNANASALNAPPVGTSLDNNLQLFAGDNTFGGFFGDVFNGNIQFFAGHELPERVRIVGDNGFVGIGTTAPVARLDVRGDVALGASGNLRAAAGNENLRIIRGQINSNGTIAQGTGFTVNRIGPGNYSITYNEPFADFATVTVSAGATPSVIVGQVASPSTIGVTASFRTAAGAAADVNFFFIAVGAR